MKKILFSALILITTLLVVFTACACGKNKGGNENGEANEEAVALFLNGKISFTDISDLVYETVVNYRNPSDFGLSDIIEANFSTRELVKNKII